MTQDFDLEQLNDTTFDLIIDEENKVYKATNGFKTAIIMQAFTDKRSTKQDISRPRDRQGWMGDILSKERGYEIGSYLYLKEQSRDTQIDKNELLGFLKNSQEYLVNIGAAKNILSQLEGDQLTITIEVDSDNIQRYSLLWRNTVLEG